ncbi:MAG: hypothetical protein ACKVIK_15110 [Rhodospirillales bacterium]|jgi:hypothetical protein
MVKESDKGSEKYSYYPSNNFSFLNFCKNPGWRLGTGSHVKGPNWYFSITISLALGFWASWADIVNGTSFIRIAVIWIFTSGIIYYFLVRWLQSLFWVMLITASATVLTVVLELRIWLLNDVWPSWLLKDLPILAGMLDKYSSEFILWFGSFSVISFLASTSLVFLVIAILSQSLLKRR